MKTQRVMITASLLAALSAASVSQAAEIYGLKPGNVDLHASGPMAFGPDGILFVGDPQAATIYAIDTGDRRGDASRASHNIDGINQKLAEQFGGETQIDTLVVNPETGNVFVSVNVRGRGPALAKVQSDGEISRVSLENVPHSKSVLPDPPEDREVGEGRRRRNHRLSSITDLAWMNGELIVSGMTNAAAPAAVRSLVFPFQKVDRGTNIEIFHAAHGRSEDYAAIQTFVPFIIDGEPNLLAGFVCTPLVKFPLSKIGKQEKVQGTTLAELGNRNRPLGMFVYEKEGRHFLLMANSARGVMKISTDNIERREGITQRVEGGGTAGQEYETITDLDGVVRLDKLNEAHAVILVQEESGIQHLRTIPLP